MERSGISARRRAAREDANPTYLARRRDLVHAAAEAFRENGYEATTLSEIAARLGTDRASLYYYVAGKEELFQEIVRDALERNLDAAERVVAAPGPADEKLANLFREMLRSFEDNYPHLFVYVSDQPRIAQMDGEWAVSVRTTAHRFEQLVLRVIEDGRREGVLRGDLPPRLVILAIFGMVNWTHRWFTPDGRYPGGEVADAFAALVTDGLRDRSGPRPAVDARP